MIEPRAVCARCRRPARVCYCAALPTLATKTRVVILQHPRERDMPIGTARMASLCLPNSALHVGIRWGESEALREALSDPAAPPILLYPGPGARDILREPPPGDVTLVVVDGTWSQAKTVVRDNPILQALPRYAFSAPAASQYRIRREPKAEYVSTIEALMYVLGALEGDPARFQGMLDPLNAMVDAQLACQAERPMRRLRHERPPRPPRTRLPAAIFERPDDLVCVVGEVNAWPYGGPSMRGRDELVHWVAHRPASGETLSMVCAPRGELSPSTSFHTHLTDEQLRAGASLDELRAAMAAFARPTDVICAWGTFSTHLWAQAIGAPLAPILDVRAAAQRLLHKKVGSLEAFAADAPPVAEGRAGRRAGLIANVLRGWQSLG